MTICNFEFGLLPTNAYSERFDGVGGSYRDLNSVSAWTATGEVEVFRSTPSSVDPNRNNASSGFQFLELSGTGADPKSSISQSLTTVSGQQYTLSFLYTSPKFSPTVDSARVSITGSTSLVELVYSFSHEFGIADPWVRFTQSFIATSTSSLVKFESLQTDSYGIGLDAISVVAVAVPEPASFTLSMLGIVGAVCYRPRRRLNNKSK